MILLDTHALIWLNLGLPQLGPRARQAADEALPEGRLAVSAVSFWEVAVLVERRRVELDRSTDRWHQELLRSGVTEVPLDGRIAITAIGLPGLHGDPVPQLYKIQSVVNRRGLSRSQLSHGRNNLLFPKVG